MKKLLATALALVVLPVAALAQEAPAELRPPSLRLGAGGAVPVSDGLSFVHGAGPSAAAGLDVPISEALDVTVDVGYTRLLLDEENFLAPIEGALPPEVGSVDFDLSGGAHNLVSGTAGLKWTFATPGRADFYLSGGTGLFYSSIGDLDVEARDAEGNLVDGDGDARIESSEEGVSFGFDLGAGVRLPLAAGVDVFVEPRYALFLSDSHYFSTRAGVSLNDVFGASPVAGSRRTERGAPAPRRYELSAGYRGTFFGDGDETGAAYRVEVARRLFSERTGVALSGAYRRAVDTDLQKGLNWKKRRGAAFDLTFFVDALQFDTGAATHRLRVGGGPAVRHQWGEQPRSVRTGTPEHPLDVERWLEGGGVDHAYRIPSDGPSTRYLFTSAFDETNWGAMLKLEYALAFDHVAVGPRAGYWYYGEGNPAMSYGLHVGVPLGRMFE